MGCAAGNKQQTTNRSGVQRLTNATMGGGTVYSLAPYPCTWSTAAGAAAHARVLHGSARPRSAQQRPAGRHRMHPRPPKQNTVARQKSPEPPPSSMRSAEPSPAGGCPDAGVAPPPAAEEGGRAGGAAIEPSGGLPGRLETHAGELPRVKLLQSGEASAAYSDERGVLGPAPMQEGLGGSLPSSPPGVR